MFAMTGRGCLKGNTTRHALAGRLTVHSSGRVCLVVWSRAPSMGARKAKHSCHVTGTDIPLSIKVPSSQALTCFGRVRFLTMFLFLEEC